MFSRKHISDSEFWSFPELCNIPSQGASILRLSNNLPSMGNQVRCEKKKCFPGYSGNSRGNCISVVVMVIILFV
jgi:hypothetical protein